MTQTITPFVQAGQVKVLDKPSLEDARATLAVPKYLADKGLKTFADIHKFEKELGGKIYGIEPGSGANTQIKAMIAKNQFGLGKFQLVESSEAGMLAAVDRAVRRKQAVVFFGWAPHPMNVNLDMVYRAAARTPWALTKAAPRSGPSPRPTTPSAAPTPTGCWPT